MDRADMTHPLTPREKVELKPCPFCGAADPQVIPYPNNEPDVWCKNSDCDGHAVSAEAWNRRTALASGSGDHAPVAWRVKDFADGWIVCGAEQTAADLAAAMSGATVQPLYGPALLAENAALRAENTEAERKLAEAVRLLRRIDRTYADMQDGNGNHPTELRKVRTFLSSKDAERG